MVFTDPAQALAIRAWRPGEELDVAVSLVRLFHLLPPSNKFIAPLIEVVLRIESVIPM